MHNLGSALTMENTVDDMLGQLIEARRTTPSSSSSSGITRKRRRRQIRNLHQAFESLGQEPKEKPCPAIEGIEKEGQIEPEDDRRRPERRTSSSPAAPRPSTTRSRSTRT